MKKKTLVPNDFRDFLSLISFIGFIGVSLYFTLGLTWISDNMNAIFLIFGGSAFLVVGKVFTVKRWLKDGLQQNEITQLLSIVVGLSSIIIGILFMFEISISNKYYGYIGILALVPAIYTLIDYIAKNN